MCFSNSVSKLILSTEPKYKYSESGADFGVEVEEIYFEEIFLNNVFLIQMIPNLLQMRYSNFQN